MGNWNIWINGSINRRKAIFFEMPDKRRKHNQQFPTEAVSTLGADRTKRLRLQISQWNGQGLFKKKMLILLKENEKFLLKNQN